MCYKYSNLGNCVEKLPEKNLSADSQPTYSGLLVICWLKGFLRELFFTITAVWMTNTDKIDE